jgi:hypothetical protein
MFAAAQDVWVLWLRTPDGTYNIVSAGPTRKECLAVFDKLLPGAAPGESLRYLPKTVDPRESRDSHRRRGSEHARAYPHQYREEVSHLRVSGRARSPARSS